MSRMYRDELVAAKFLVGDRTSDIGIVAGEGEPTDGGEGTGAAALGKGSLYIDTENGYLYENRGTKASPVWDAVGVMDTADLEDGAVITAKIADGAVTEDKLFFDIDDSTLEAATVGEGFLLRVKAIGVDESHLKTSVAGDGLVGGNGDPLNLTLTETTIVEPVAGTALLEGGGANAKVLLTADTAGVAANAYTFEVINAGAGESLDIAIDGTAITITAATDGEGDITTTANDLITTFNLDDTVNTLFTASLPDGTGNDPLIVEGPISVTGGVDGTTGWAGRMLFDTTNLYLSTDVSTVSVGNWKKITLESL